MQITCSHCKYTWDYKGKYTSLATCPNCQKKTKINPEVNPEYLKKLEKIKKQKGIVCKDHQDLEKIL